MIARIAKLPMPALALIGLSSGCALEASSSSSEESAEISSSEESAETPYCVVQLPSNMNVCYSTVREAVKFATGGQILDASETDIGSENLARRINALPGTPTVSVVLGHFFADRAWSGDLLFFTAPFGCDTSIDVDWEVFDLSAGTSFNDRITSFEPFSNCLVTLWEHAGFQGASFGPFGKISFGGSAMDDKASSIQFH